MLSIDVAIGQMAQDIKDIKVRTLIIVGLENIY